MIYIKRNIRHFKVISSIQIYFFLIIDCNQNMLSMDEQHTIIKFCFVIANFNIRQRRLVKGHYGKNNLLGLMGK